MSNQATADAVFDALGEPVRRQILEQLRDGPLPVGELARKLPVGRPAVSKHLRVLSRAGLVRHDSRGTRNLYALAPPGMVAAQQWLVGIWDTALASYADALRQEVDTHEGSAP
ncbi:MAG TPA: metalloregulator ArsR/SmtB family transcription factor [Gaiellales bacterium]